MSDRTHEYLAVDRALTGPERADLIRRWYEINPHQRGALAADILDQLDSTDAHLDVVEPLEDEHRDEYPGRPIGLCALAVIYAYAETEPGRCLRCHGAGKVPAIAALNRPAQDPCGRCDGSGTAEVPIARWELVEALLRRVILPGDVVRLAGGATRPTAVNDEDYRNPVHAFRLTDDGLAETSLCGRQARAETDIDPGDPIAYELAELDTRCAWCDSRMSDLRAIQAKVTGP